MDKKEINQLLLNQKIYKTNLSIKWLTEDIRNLNQIINKTALDFRYFYKIYEQVKK